MKHQTPSLAKFKKLMRRLGFSKVRETMGLLEALWLLTQSSSPRGDIGSKLDNEDIAIELEWDGDPDFLVDSLVETRWLDRCSKYRLVVHDWADHAPRFVHGVAAKKGGMITTIVDDYSPPLQSATVDPLVDDCTRQQPNHTKHNLTKPNQTKDSQEAITPLQIIDSWNDEMGTKVTMTERRRKTIISRLKNQWWAEHWPEALSRVRGSPFLMGENDRGWKADIDFFIKPDSVNKIIEGSYDNKTRKSKSGRQRVPGGREFAPETL